MLLLIQSFNMHMWWKRWGWAVRTTGKIVLVLAILLGVGRQFYLDLRDPTLVQLSLRWPWLFVSGVLYLSALTFSSVYWYRLLWIFGQKPALRVAVRAYFIGHLGKYVPGKAWALLMRGTLVRGPEVRLSVAILTAFYEVLTTMASGALVAALVFLFQPPQFHGLRWHPVFTGFLLLVVIGVPLLPGVFNFLVKRMAARFEKVESLGLPTLRIGTLAQGLALTGVGWIFLGASLWAMLCGVLPEEPALDYSTWAHYSGSIGLAYVAGFLAVVMPSGVGVREYFLRNLLVDYAGPAASITAAVLLLRLLWTSAELVVVGLVFWWRKSEPRSQEAGINLTHDP